MDKEALIKSIESSSMTPEQIEALNNTIRLQMASSLVASVTCLDKADREVEAVTGRIANFVSSKLASKLDTNTLTLEEAISYLDKLNNIQVRVAETKRKIFNGKEMFASSPLTSQELALLELLKKIDTAEKREKLEGFLSDISEKEEQDDNFEE